MPLKRNILANFLGQGWSAFMGIALVPVYINYLGMEAYGLIGIFVVLQTWLSLLDVGMTPTLSREIARYTAGAHTAETVRDLVHSFEIICFGIASLIAVAMFALSDWFATYWLSFTSLSVSDITLSVAVMGLVAAFRFVDGLYRGVLLGFQKHVWLNITSSILVTLRGLGAVGVLIWVSPTIQAFFLWQAAVSALSVVALRWGVGGNLPCIHRDPEFSLSTLSLTYKFAGGMFLTTLLSLLLTQLDKVLLSRLLRLEEFGTYMFATAVAGVLFQLIVPIFNSYSPRLTGAVTRNDGSAISMVYHQGAQLMSVVVLPAGFVLIMFCQPLLLAWTRNDSLAASATPIVMVLALGTMLNGCMHMPYMLQLAYGWTSFSVWLNMVMAALLVPAVLIAAPRFGPVGVAWVWVALNTFHLLISIHLMHRRLLPNDKWTWFSNDVAKPVLATSFLVILSWLLAPDNMPASVLIPWVAFTLVLATTAAVFSVPSFRHRAFSFFVRWRR